MRRIGSCFVLLGLLVTAAAQGPFPAPARASDNPPFGGRKDGGRNPEVKPRPKFILGKETTYVTGPLGEDGRIDYVAALNERLRGGVTPATNANVLIWKAFGPRPEGARMPREFFTWLGVEEPPERGDYFLTLARYARDRLGVVLQNDIEALYDQLMRASQEPWTAKQYPALARWLKASEKSLDLAVEATKRPHYYSPLVPIGRDGERYPLIGSLLPAVQKCREVANALPARAMLRVGEGRPADGWQDLLACHHLGRLVGRGGTLIEGLVGFAIDNIASGADLDFLGRARLSTRQVKDCLRDLRRLPPLPALADKVDLTERFMFLDVIMTVERKGIHEGLRSLQSLVGASLETPRDPLSRRILADFDWNALLRTGNRYYDRLVAAMRLPDRKLREKQLERLEQDLLKRKQALVKAGGLGKALLAAPGARARGELLGDALLGLLSSFLRKVPQAFERVGQVGSNVQVAFALAAYQREHGRYPPKLEALAPRYLPRIPQDVFSGKALIYRPTEKGYLLYSVGVNGLDEQGHSYDDDPPGDDLSVRMPLPKLRRR
jgi:hypothetical protein